MRCVTFALLFAVACAGRAPEMPRIPERSVSFSIDQPLVKLPCAWPVGATYRYTYERRREDAQVSDLGAATFVAPAVLTVSAPDRLTLDIGRAEINGPAGLIEPLRAMVGDDDRPAKELVFRDGEVVGVKNYAELSGEVDRELRMLMPYTTSPEVFGTIRATYDNPRAAVSLMLVEPTVLLGALCSVMGDGQEDRSADETPSPFEGLTVRREMIVTATIEPEAGIATYVIETTTNQMSLLKMMKEAESARSRKKRAELHAEVAEHELYFFTVAVHSLADGMPLSVEATKTIGGKVYPFQRADHWRWTRVTEHWEAP